MRLILLVLCLLAALRAHAAAPGQLAPLDALFDKRAAGIGVYSQAVGVLKALKDGLEGKFNEPLDTAINIELPWPKRDLAESAKLYEKVIAKFPENLRAHYYLAETLLADDKAEKAREAILKVKQGSVAYDPAEGRRVHEWAKQVEAKIAEELE